MTRRTHEWWARLTSAERSELVLLELSDSRSMRSGYYPDDCVGCGMCGTPHLGSGLCPMCRNRLSELLNKAEAA